MVKYRKFDREERSLCERQMKKLEASLEYQDFKLEDKERAISKGLRLNYEATLRKLRTEYHEEKAAVETIKFNLDSLRDQLKKGVPIKQVKKNEN